MLTASAMQQLAAQIVSCSDRAFVLAASNRQKIATVTGDKTRSSEWIQQNVTPLRSAPEIRALIAQGEIGMKTFAEELAQWRRPMQVLRSIARPSLGASQDEQLRWSNAMQETQLVAGDPGSLQAVLDDAVHVRNWPLVYACLMGRVNDDGFPLQPGSKFHGVALQALPLPGIEEVEKAAYDVALAGCTLSKVGLEVRTWAGNTGSVWKYDDFGAPVSLETESCRVRATKQYEEGKARRARLQKMTLMEAWEELQLAKDGGKEGRALKVEIADIQAKIDAFNTTGM